MKLFLDANILISVVNNEYPLFTYSSRVLSLCDNPKFEVYTSPLCLAITFYFAEKKSGTKLALQKMSLLSSKLKIAGTNEFAVAQTVANKKIKDFEDGLQYYSAVQSKCKCIVTQDTADFYFSEIPVMDAQSFLESHF